MENSIAKMDQSGLERIKSMMLAGLSDNSHPAYDKAFDDFVSWWQSDPRPLTREIILAWLESIKAKGLSSSTINLRLSAIRKLAREAAYVVPLLMK